MRIMQNIDQQKHLTEIVDKAQIDPETKQKFLSEI